MYKTGDVMRKVLIDINGREEIHYVFERRRDDQVKIDGFRIELQEIESVYLQNKEVAVIQVAAVVRDNRLNIYLKLADNSYINLQIKKLTNHARQYLPHYMVTFFPIEINILYSIDS